MCNLYAMTSAQAEIRSLFDVPAARDLLGNAEPYKAIYPKYDGPVVRLGEDGRELLDMHWGFVMPQVSKKTGKPIQPRAVNNARDDKLHSSRFWRKSFEERRYLIPATSFCEAKGKQPATFHWFGVDDRSLFAFAGIWQPWKGNYGGDLRELETYSMVTSTPNEIVKPVHPDRMPVILAQDDWETWLTGTPEQAFDLLKPFPADRMEIIDKGEDMKSEPA